MIVSIFLFLIILALVLFLMFITLEPQAILRIFMVLAIVFLLTCSIVLLLVGRWGWGILCGVLAIFLLWRGLGKRRKE